MTDFWRFVSSTEHLGEPLSSSHNPVLVVLSVLVACLAAYSSLAVVGRILQSKKVATRYRWLAVGSFAMGAGVWAMHFVAMLAFTTPISVGYDIPCTIVSIVPAILASAAALWVMTQPNIGWKRFQVGGVLMALGIGTMHYVGMEAMRMNAHMVYDLPLFIISIVVAYILATLSLHILAVFSRDSASNGYFVRFTSAAFMGFAIAAMHYIAMLAVIFFPAPDKAVPEMIFSQAGLGFATSIIASTIIGLVIIGTMIDRRLAEAASSVRASDLLSRVILDSVSEGVVGQDIDGRVTFVNRGAVAMLGYEPEELIGLFPNELQILASGSSAADPHSIFKVSASGARHEIDDLTLARKDASSFPAQCSASPINIDGRIEGAVVTFTDITKRKRDEQALIAARALAEAASEAKSDFLTRMSHEIRTPMNGVLGMTELLLNTGLGQRQLHLARTAHKSAETLLGVIDNVLDFSKIEAGHAELKIEDFELRPMLEDVLESLAEQAHGKGLELVQDLALDLPERVRGDAARLRQVLINLLGNSLKFTDSGEVCLRARPVEESGSGAKVHFSVTDSGPGIALHRQKNIFDEFIQEDGSISRQHGGTGLGLAICQRILGLMDSELKLQSVPGEGASFAFTVLFDLGRRVHTGNNVSVDVLSGVRAMIVDDNATNRQILHSQIMNWAMRNGSVSNGKEALRRLQEAAAAGDPYEVVLLDWHMPEMDGIALARAITADPSIPPLHLIMLSSGSPDMSQALNRETGIANMLRKPVRQQLLQDCLCKLFGAKPVPQPAYRTTADTSPNTGGRILLAEDNLVNKEVALGMLEDLHCDVDVVDNGEQAVDAFANTHYDLVLMDCHMPKLDGFAATRAIRMLEQDRQEKPTPIVAITADVQKGITDQCIEAGMDAYLSKPFGMQSLKALLRQWLPDATRAKSVPPDSTQHADADSTGNIDLNTVSELRRVGEKRGTNLLARVAEAYRTETPKILAEAHAACKAKRSSQLFDAAHSLKSSSANIGALGLSALCARLEAESRLDNPDRATALLHAITELLPDVIRELSALTGTAPVESETSEDNVNDGQSVLIVDDDSSFRMILHEILEDEGFVVIEADNGEQAIELAQRNRPDVMLLDAIMEGVNGFEVCQHFKSDSQLSDVPVVMVTGLDDVHSINRALQSGASGFVTKPVNYPILIQQLRFVLHASQLQAQSDEKQAQLEAAQQLARIGYWNWDVGAGRLEISAQLADLLNIHVEKFGHDLESYIQLVHKDDRRRVRTMMDTMLAEGSLPTSDYRLVDGNGVDVVVRQDLAIKAHGGRVDYVLGTVQDITRQRAAEDQIRDLAYFDTLTGLASRRHLMQKLGESIKLAQRRNESFALLFLDLDAFKDVNDSMGHDIGDRLLQIVAGRLQGTLREGDYVARLGGDEFCMIIPGLPDQYTMAEVGQRCLDAVGEPVELMAQRLQPQMSIGIAQYPQDGDSSHSLLKAADSAMYAAKRAGKNRFAFYNQKMTEAAQARLTLDSDLRKAFDDGEFVLHYQPQISLSTGCVTGVEALVRWEHPKRGLLLPDAFISAIERIGMVSKLDDFVINSACAQLQQWRLATISPLCMSVNISPSSFREQSFVNSICSALQKYAIEAGTLQIEVTESVMQSAPEAREVMQQLKQLGVKIAIDDFGAGYSSLGSLKHLPINQLKIDRLFIRDMHGSNEDAILLGTVIGLAHALGYTVVGEGVEELSQLQVLIGVDCDIVQGVYISKPVAAHEIPALLNQSYLPAEDYTGHVRKSRKSSSG